MLPPHTALSEWTGVFYAAVALPPSPSEERTRAFWAHYVEDPGAALRQLYVLLFTGKVEGCSLQAFENAFVATGGGPAYATYFYALHIYNSAFAFGEMGYGSALAVFNFVILVTLTYLNFSLSKRWVYYAGEVKQ